MKHIKPRPNSYTYLHNPAPMRNAVPPPLRRRGVPPALLLLFGLGLLAGMVLAVTG